MVWLMLGYQFSPKYLSQCIFEKNKILLRISQLGNVTTFIVQKNVLKTAEQDEIKNVMHSF